MAKPPPSLVSLADIRAAATVLTGAVAKTDIDKSRTLLALSEDERRRSVIGEAGANIVEVYHQRVFTDLPARGTALDLVVETRDRAHLRHVLDRLTSVGFVPMLKGGHGRGTA